MIRNKGFTIIELIIVLFMLVGFISGICNRLNEDEKMSRMKQLTVISYSGYILYEGKANWILPYTFGTGVKFYDGRGVYHEIEGNATIKFD